MAHVFLFVLVFPFLNVVFFFAYGFLAKGNPLLPNSDERLAVLGFAYALLFLPSLLIAVTDAFVRRRGSPYPFLWLAVAGVCSVPISLWVVFNPGWFGWREIMTFGGIGGLSAAVCWFVVEWTQGALRRKPAN